MRGGAAVRVAGRAGRRRLTAVAVLGALALSGCTSIPRAGAVHEGPLTVVGSEEPAVRVVAAPPREGASAADVVRGFLLASASFENDSAAARLYLTQAAATAWRPDRGVTVYQSDSLQLEVVPDASGQRATARLTVREVGQVDAAGQYRQLAEPTSSSVALTLARERGEWRISRLEDGLLLTAFDVGRAFTALSAYFLTPDRTRVVPDPLLLPRRPALATVLTQRVLAGPSPWLAPAVVSALPSGARLSVASVPVVDGVAQVDLDDSVLGLPAAALAGLSAQLVWTLRQLPDVRAVHLTVHEQDLQVPGVPAEQPVDSWDGYDPVGLASGVPAYVVRGDRLGTLVQGQFSPVPGPAGDGRTPLARPALSLDGRLVAGTTAGATTLMAGEVGPGEQLTPVLRGGELAGPSWDPQDRLWTVDRRSGAVWRLRLGQQAQAVTVEDPGGRVRAVRVARDGTRALVVVRDAAGHDRLELGVVVERGDGPRIQGLYLLDPEAVRVRDAAWVDDHQVALAVGPDAGAAAGGDAGDGAEGVLVTDLFGQPSTPTGSLSAPPVAVAAAPAPHPLLVQTVDGRLWSSSGRAWLPVGTGRDPVYPG
ncbi:MAG: LpqB family beta-propeller domain-containing protein [Motilibacteraceae bacterium]